MSIKSTSPKMSTQKNSSPADFEADLRALEAIVSEMESGQLPLQASLEAYQRGMTLLQSCQQSLADAEQQVRILTEANKLAPFNPKDDKS